MKKFYYLLIGLLMCQNVESQILFFEDFEAPNSLDKWTITSATSSLPIIDFRYDSTWTLAGYGLGLPNSIQSVWLGGTLDNSQNLVSDEHLTSPEFTLPAGKQIIFSFYFIAKTHDNAPDGIPIWWFDPLLGDINITLKRNGNPDVLIWNDSDNPLMHSGEMTRDDGSPEGFPWSHRDILKLKFDLSAYAGETVSIDWHSFEHPRDGYFQIDNVEVKAITDNDIAIISANHADTSSTTFRGPISYAKVPRGQEGILEFSAFGLNFGASAVTDATLNVSVKDPSNNVVYTGSGTTKAMPLPATPHSPLPSEQDTLFAGYYEITNAQLGTYEVTNMLSLNSSTDEAPSNNSIVTTFEITDNVFARNEGISIDGHTTWSTVASTGGFEVGPMYKFQTKDTIVGMTIQLARGTTANPGLFYADIYTMEGTPANSDLAFISLLSEQEIFPVVDSNFLDSHSDNLGALIYVRFDTPIEVTPGMVIVPTLGSFGSPGQEIWVAFEEDYPNTGTAVIAQDGGDFAFINQIPWINLLLKGFDFPYCSNYECTVGILENEREEILNISLSQNYPNPFNQQSVISYELIEAANVSYEMMDLSGRIVLSENNGKKTTGKHQITIDAKNFSSGIYYFTINAGDEKVTKKIAVAK